MPTASLALKSADVEICKRSNKLDLTGRFLHKWPAEIWQLAPYLKVLKLSRNYLKDIPEAIVKLENLESLIIDDNQIRDLPQALGEMSSLRILNVENNPLPGKIMAIYRRCPAPYDKHSGRGDGEEGVLCESLLQELNPNRPPMPTRADLATRAEGERPVLSTGADGISDRVRAFVESLSLARLREELERRDLSISGRQHILADRLAREMTREEYEAVAMRGESSPVPEPEQSPGEKGRSGRLYGGHGTSIRDGLFRSPSPPARRPGAATVPSTTHAIAMGQDEDGGSKIQSLHRPQTAGTDVSSAPFGHDGNTNDSANEPDAYSTQRVLKDFDIANAQRSASLDLSRRYVTVIPTEVYGPLLGDTLRVLRLAYNELRVLPPEMAGSMPNLRELNLDANRFQTLPFVLACLPALRLFSMEDNPLSNDHQAVYDLCRRPLNDHGSVESDIATKYLALRYAADPSAPHCAAILLGSTPLLSHDVALRRAVESAEEASGRHFANVESKVDTTYRRQIARPRSAIDQHRGVLHIGMDETHHKDHTHFQDDTTEEHMKHLSMHNDNGQPNCPGKNGHLDHYHQYDDDIGPEGYVHRRHLRDHPFEHLYKNARNTGFLDLRDQHLTEFPQDILQDLELQKRLKVLDLSTNRLRVLPESIDVLSGLQEIYLGGNDLRELPLTLGNLEHLKRIGLDDNPLFADLQRIVDESKRPLTGRGTDASSLLLYLRHQAAKRHSRESVTGGASPVRSVAGLRKDYANDPWKEHKEMAAMPGNEEIVDHKDQNRSKTLEIAQEKHNGIGDASGSGGVEFDPTVYDDHDTSQLRDELFRRGLDPQGSHAVLKNRLMRYRKQHG
eukprot:Clim_evm74s22 gene=Clim_evmTU74s22